MPAIPYPVELKLPEKLKDQEYRRKFFLAEASARIAAQLIALRKRRGLNQKQVAELTHTRQPAISRVEQSDYQNWSFNTLRAITDALDARIRVVIEPSEDILKEYEGEKNLLSSASIPEPVALASQSAEAFNASVLMRQYASGIAAQTKLYCDVQNIVSILPNQQTGFPCLPGSPTSKDAEIQKLREENARLRSTALMISDPPTDQINPMAVIFGRNEPAQRRAI